MKKIFLIIIVFLILFGAFYIWSWKSSYYNGEINEVIFWNRSLSQSQVTDLYDSGNNLEKSNNTIKIIEDLEEIIKNRAGDLE